MKNLNYHLLEFSAPAKEVMLMKITKKMFMQLQKNGIDREYFEELAGKIELNTILSTTTYEPGGYEVDLRLDGESVSGFEQYFQSLLDSKSPDDKPEILLSPTKSNRTTYYIYWEQFFKRKHYKFKFKGEFSFDKLKIFFPKDILIGNKILTGFELMYGGYDFREEFINFSSDELCLIDSNGSKFSFEIHD